MLKLGFKFKLKHNINYIIPQVKHIFTSKQINVIGKRGNIEPSLSPAFTKTKAARFYSRFYNRHSKRDNLVALTRAQLFKLFRVSIICDASNLEKLVLEVND